MSSSSFRHALPPSRLGERRESLSSYEDAIAAAAVALPSPSPSPSVSSKPSPPARQFSLIVVVEQRTRRILLGKKKRGFGEGLYNCFGGKIEENESSAECAVRELKEETNLRIPLHVVEKGRVGHEAKGALRFSFEDGDVNGDMLVHLFRVNVTCVGGEGQDGVASPSHAAKYDNRSGTPDDTRPSHDHAKAIDASAGDGDDYGGTTVRRRYLDEPSPIDPLQIRGCDEIEPRWFEDYREVPFHEMFADDTVWLTRLLEHYEANEGGGVGLESPTTKMDFDARFHYRRGGAATNSVMHYYFQSAFDGATTDKLCRPLSDVGAPAESAANILVGSALTSDNCGEFSIASSKSQTTTSPPQSSPAPPSSPPKQPLAPANGGTGATFERRLFHALHRNDIHSPSIKEFKENWTMANAVRDHIGDESIVHVIDVAGGHGALAALFLLLIPGCRTATVVDPAKVGGEEGVRKAWGGLLDERRKATGLSKKLLYRRECLRTGLRKELDRVLHPGGDDDERGGGAEVNGGRGNGGGDGERGGSTMTTPFSRQTRVLVVACHACQHLTDETLRIASGYGVNVAVMPCCQKDLGGAWKELGKRILGGSGGGGKKNRGPPSSASSSSLPIGPLMDLLAAGKMMAWRTGSEAGVRYRVKIKLMDEKITVQNRMILCKAVSTLKEDGELGDGSSLDGRVERAHVKLELAYRRAHRKANGGCHGEGGANEVTPPADENLTGFDDASSINRVGRETHDDAYHLCVRSVTLGFCIGAVFAAALAASRLRRI